MEDSIHSLDVINIMHFTRTTGC